MARSRVPDGCVVPTDPLAEAVRGFLDDWHRERPQTAGQFSSRTSSPTTDVTPMRGVAKLAWESAVSEDSIQNIIDRRYRTTELRIADPLAQAIDREDLLLDGGPCQPFPNPNAPRALRGGSDGNCGCSGSLTGAVVPAD